MRPRQRTSATPLALGYGLLVAYASLYPFSGWSWPTGRDLTELAVLPWLGRATAFDEWSNLLGYLPLGMLVFVAALRSARQGLTALLGAAVVCAGLSYALEVLQQVVPGRVPSARDFALNATGGLAGAFLGAWLWKVGVLDQWQTWRDRWFMPRSAGAIALLFLWPVALLFPSPIPLAPGQLLEPLSEWVSAGLEGTPFETDVASAIERELGRRQPLAPLSEGLAIALGVLGPCLLSHAVMRPGWRRVVAVAVTLAVGMTAMGLSTALNFGPVHGLSWLSARVAVSMGLGGTLALLLAWVPPRVAALLALLALTALVVMVAQSPPDPYYAESLQRWEQGRFVRFHGLAQWVGWTWPYAAIAWLFHRLAARSRNLE